MKHSRNSLGVCFLVCLITLSIFPMKQALAQTSGLCIEPLPVEYVPPRGGIPASAIIACPFAGSEADRIYAYDRDDDLRAGTGLRSALDFEDDLWVFSPGGENRAALIIDFHRDGSAVVADLYDDQNGDSRVAYHAQDGNLTIDESKHWSVRVRAKDGWWRRDDGTPNMNLELFVDGPIFAAFQSEAILRQLANDGTPDFHAQVVDENNDGRPDWEWIDVWPNAPADWAVARTLLMVNTQKDEPSITNAILWPYLGTAFSIYDFVSGPDRTGTAHPLLGPNNQQYGIVQGYNQRSAPLQIYWQSAKIAFVSEFVASRGSEHNWFMYSVKRIQPNQLSDANFEAPFGFFDLANDHDGLPELQVRLETSLPEDIRNGLLEQPIAAVRYSWDQNNDDEWDYKVDTSVDLNTEPIAVGDLRFRSIPYEKLPALIRQSSNIVMFVARAGRPYKLQGPLAGERDFMMEGIYTGGTVDTRQYRAGLDTALPTNLFGLAPIGDRVEYRTKQAGQPALYFSSVDHSLHLLSAEGGNWNVPQIGGGEIRYANLNGDGYIDQWDYQQVGSASQPAVSRQLNISPSHLLYSGEMLVAIRQAQVRPALFETLPPTNHAEWQALGAKLDANKREVAPGDFRAMLEQFAGPELRITGATLRDYRSIGQKDFRFVLDLQPGYTVAGDQLLDLARLQPGSYAVSYDGAFHIEPLSLPVLQLRVPVAGLAAEPAMALHTALLRFQLSSDAASADAPLVTVRAEALAPDGRVVPIGDRQLAVLAGATTPITFDWAPPAAGDWQIRVTAITTPTLDAPPMTAHFDTTLPVAPAALPSVTQAASAFGLVPLPALAGLLLAALIAAGLLGRYLLPTIRRTRP